MSYLSIKELENMARAHGVDPNEHLVCGFAYWTKINSVALIRKARPKWQKCLLNGVGGHVEFSESPVTAMVREFQEETSVITRPDDWRLIAAIVMAEEKLVHFFATQLGHKRSYKLRTTTDEEVGWFQLEDEFPQEAVVQNLRWLVPLGFHVIFRDPSYSIIQITSDKETA